MKKIVFIILISLLVISCGKKDCPKTDASDNCAELFKKPATIAAGMRVPIAVGDYLIINSVNQSNGTALKINDKDMVEGVKKMSSKEGA